MSSATAAVRFDDGTVKWCIYHGTSDVLLPRLHDTIRAAWNGKNDGWPDIPDHGEHVAIYSDYGAGFWWEGIATREVVIAPLAPCDDEPMVEIHKGAPAWFTTAHLAQPAPFSTPEIGSTSENDGSTMP